MSNFVRKLKAGLVKFPAGQYIGNKGQIFYNEDTGQLYLSDGVTPGGVEISGTSGLVISNTDDLPEGNNNLYFTEQRAIDAIGSSLDDSSTGPNVLWSADKIISFVSESTDGIQETTGISDADLLIRSNSAGYLDSTFLEQTTTDDISEGSINLYYTESRFDDSFTTKTSDDLPEGVDNLYFTESKVREQIDLYEHANVFVVDLDPVGERQYSTIADALAAINNEINLSEDNRAVIAVGPGLYIEQPFTLPQWVSVKGIGTQTLIAPAVNSQNFITLEINTVVSDATISGPTGADTVMFDFDFSQSGLFVLERLRLGNSAKFMEAYNNTANSIVVYMNDIIALVGANVSTPFYFENLSTGSIESIVNNYGHKMINPIVNINHYFSISGNNASLIIITAFVDNVSGQVNHLFNAENGSSLTLNSVISNGTDTAVHVPNIGSAPYVRTISLVSSAENYNVFIEHPGTTGNISGTMDSTKIFVDPDAPATVSVVDPAGSRAGKIFVGNLYQGDRFDRSINLTRLLRRSATLGVIDGGDITAGASLGQIDVSSGTGYIRDSADDYVTEVSWNNATLSVPPGTGQWITVNSSGVVQAFPSPPANLINFILLGRVYTSADGEVRFVEDIAGRIEHNDNLAEAFFRDALGPVFASGSIVGTSLTPYRINISNGRYYYGATRYTPSGGSEVEFSIVYRDGEGSHFQIDNQQNIPVQYDNGTGSLAPLSTGYFAKHSLYLVGHGANEYYYLVLGQTEYDNIAVAEQADLPLPPGFIAESFALIASIIVKEGESNIVEIRDERPVVGFRPSGISAATTHGNLIGLTADDHPQYLRADGDRALSGNLNLNSNNIINVSNVNGVAVESHSSRHLPNGSDPLALGMPVAINTSNSMGVQNSFARSDHVHAHGNLAGGTLHALATQSTAGFLSSSNKTFIDGLTSTGTDSLAEGTTNLYFTNERVDDRVSNLLTEGNDIDLVYDDVNNTLTVSVISSASSVSNTIVKRDSNKAFNIGSIVFDLENPAQHTPGTLHWNVDAGGLEVDMANSTVRLQVGQELLTRAFNNSGSTISNGTVVIISGSQLNLTVINPAEAGPNIEYSGVLGVATEDIADQELGFIASYGLLRDLDTSMFDVGDELYLSASIPGSLTNVRPTAPNKEIFIGVVVRSHATLGTIFVSPQINKKLDNLSDVQISNIQDGDIIQWDTNRFINTDGFSTFASASDFATHASRHLPNGADPLATGVPVTIGTSNSIGVANAFSRQDHVHAHGNQPGGSLHAEATQSTAGFMSSSDKTRLDNIEDTIGIQLTTGAADADTVVRTDANGRLDNSFIDLSRIYQTSTTSFSTTSTTFTTISETTITPAAGTYMVYYNSTAQSNSNNTTFEFAFFLNGTVISNTVRQYNVTTSGIRLGATIIAVITVNGTDQIDTRLRVTAAGSTITTYNRSMTAVRIGP